MAAMTARLHYAGDRRPVVVKQTTREEPGAHPELTGAESWTGRAMDERFDVHSSHGGASNDDGDVLAAAVVKRIKQPVIEHHEIKAKLELC